MAQLVPEAKDKLAKFKNQVSTEMGVPFTDYNGDLTSKQCGSVAKLFFRSHLALPQSAA